MLSRRWVLDPTLAQMLVALEAWATREAAGAGFRWPGIQILSGYRSFARQAQVNPAAPNSLHTRCPSMAADLRLGSFTGVSEGPIWDWLGAKWMLMGGRWGGMFHSGRDENHFDLGVGN
jgi:hypothetical protein